MFCVVDEKKIKKKYKIYSVIKKKLNNQKKKMDHKIIVRTKQYTIKNRQFSI